MYDYLCAARCMTHFFLPIVLKFNINNAASRESKAQPAGNDSDLCVRFRKNPPCENKANRRFCVSLW